MAIDSVLPSNGCVTDVEGVRVGHFQRTSRGYRTGTTVILLPDGTTGGVDVRGGAPGTRETDLLDPTNLVDAVHAISLSGGSAFGLAPATGVMEVLARKGVGLRVGADPSWVVPIVPGAVIFDLGRGGRFDARPDADFGVRATRAARSTASRVGSVGAGTGARSGGLAGGIGTASIALGDGLVVAALAVVNSLGSTIDDASGRPWFDGRHRLRRPSRADLVRLTSHLNQMRNTTTSSASLNTTIGVVITNADLDKAECTRLAGVAHDGLARAIRPAHSMNDGDTIFGLATRRHALAGSRVAASFGDPDSRSIGFNRLLIAAADAFAEACITGVLAATGRPGLPSYHDLCPSAFSA